MVLRRFFIETGYTSNNPSDWNRIEQSGLPTNQSIDSIPSSPLTEWKYVVCFRCGGLDMINLGDKLKNIVF